MTTLRWKMPENDSVAAFWSLQGLQEIGTVALLQFSQLYWDNESNMDLIFQAF